IPPSLRRTAIAEDGATQGPVQPGAGACGAAVATDSLPASRRRSSRLSLDLLRFFQGLSRYERELGGRGLTWDEAHSQGAADTVRLVVAPNERHGAKERLTRLADVVMGVVTSSSAVELGLSDSSRSFMRWEAVLLDDAA